MATEIDNLTRAVNNYRFDLKKQTASLDKMTKEMHRSNNLLAAFLERIDKLFEMEAENAT